MLSTFRKALSGFFAKVLLSVLILSFAFWGIGDIVKGTGSSVVVATVGGEPIYLSELQNEIDRFKRSYGSQIPEELLEGLNLPQYKIADLVNERLFQLEADRLGLAISKKELIAQVAKNPSFHNSNGKFDRNLFMQTIQRNGMNELTFRDNYRKELRTRILLNSFSISPIISEDALDILYSVKYEKRKVLLATISKVPVTEKAKGEIDEEKLKEFYKAHKDSYVAPEYRSFNYIEITPKHVDEHIEISRQELFEIYESRKEEYRRPESRELKQLLYSSKSDAERAYQLMQEHKDIDYVASRVRPDNQGDLYLGNFFADQVTVGKDEVFSLAEGEYTKPISSPFGWHIYQVLSINAARILSFDEVKDRLEEELRLERSEEVLRQLQEQIEDSLAGGASLKEAAEIAGVEFGEVKNVDRRGNVLGEVESLTGDKYQKMISRAFELAVHEQSEFMPAGDSSYIMVELVKVVDERSLEFDEVREQVKKDWEKYNNMLEKYNFASKIAEEINGVAAGSGGSIHNIRKILKSHGIDEIYEVILGRDGMEYESVGGSLIAKGRKGHKLADSALSSIFSLKKIGESTGAMADGEDYQIAILVDNIEAIDKDTEEGRKLYNSIRRSLESSYSDELIVEYLKKLRNRYKVDIDRGVLLQAFSKDDTTGY